MIRHPVLLGVLAALPAVLSWWWHRGLRKAGDAAVLPERVAWVNQRVAATASACAMVAVAAAGWRALWVLPLLFAGVAGATYPTRRLLFGETWPFHRYLAWRARVVCGFAGFFLLLAAAPALLAAAPPQARAWAGALLLAVLLAWHHWHARLLLLIVGATRLERADLAAAFAPVLERTTAPAPEVWHAGPAGGVLANALALPGRRRGRVLFFDTLLDRLSPRETAAIFAHEVAHLEHFDPRRMRLTYAAGVGIIAAALGLSLAVAGLLSRYDGWLQRLWPAVVVAALMVRARRTQANETASDLRAVELCGDPEALVGALTRLHAIHHIPRRWSAQVEEHASHPSLARRIRAIRAASQGAAVRRLDERLIVPSTEPGRVAVFDRSRVAFAWLDPHGGSEAPDPLGAAKRLEAVAYEELCELRLSAGAGHASLVARARQGGSWTLPLRPSDVPRVQVVLNTVDQLVAPHAPATWAAAGRRIAALVALAAAATLSSLLTVLMPALLAMLRPTRPALAALATALVAGGLVIDSGSTLGAIRALVFALLAGVALWTARARTPGEDARLPLVPAWVEGLWLSMPMAAGALWMGAANRYDLFGLHVTARDGAWLAASAAALTGYLAASSVCSHRRLSAGPALLALAVLWFGSSSFLHAVVRDPLAADMPFLRQGAAALTPAGTASVDGSFARVRLSRDGRYFLLTQYEGDGDREDPGEPQRHVVGSFDGWSREFEAVEAVFAADGVLLVARHAAGRVTLHSEPVRGSGAGWTLSIDDADAQTLTAGPHGRWTMLHRRGHELTIVTGRLGSQAVERKRRGVDTNEREYVTDLLHRDGAAALAVASEWLPPSLRWIPSAWRSRTSFLRVDAGGTTRMATTDLTVSCADRSEGEGGPVCAAYDGRFTRFWRYDDAGRRFEPRGQVRGVVWSFLHDTGDIFAANVYGRPALVDLGRGEMVLFERSMTGTDLATSAGFVARATQLDGTTMLTLHRAETARRTVGVP